MGRIQSKTQFNIFIISIILSSIDANPIKRNEQVEELQTAGSSYSQQYYDWGGNKPGGYSFDVTGNGLIEDSYGHEPNGVINPYPGNESGLGGYGGFGGNGGFNSYYGYNNPYYQEANHLGFGYYKKFGYGNIYSNGVTPNLVVGYRGYSRR